MGRFANISGKAAVKAFKKFGYDYAHTSGDHAILQKKMARNLKSPTGSLWIETNMAESNLVGVELPDYNLLES